jgi:hypothetical protein
VIKYGVTNHPPTRLGDYALELGCEFSGMQLISGPLPRAQGLALETWLVNEGRAQGMRLLNKRLITLAEMKGGAFFYGVVETPTWALETPRLTLLNPAIYR